MDLSDIKLPHSWSFYDNIKCTKDDYTNGINIIGTCSTVYEFWACYDNVHKPSIVFYSKEKGKPYYIKDNVKREITSMCLFKDNITPTWEDPKNATGGQLDIRKSEDTDFYWFTLCTNIVSNNIHDDITGFRIVDSSNQITEKILFRIEIWLTTLDNVTLIEKKIRTLLNMSPLEKIIIKKHT